MYQITKERLIYALLIGLALAALNLSGCASCGPDNQKRDCLSGAAGWGGIFGGF